jgi:hypothetical protein
MVTYNTKSRWIRQILNCKARTYKEWCLKITPWTPLEENSKKQSLRQFTFSLLFHRTAHWGKGRPKHVLCTMVCVCDRSVDLRKPVLEAVMPENNEMTFSPPEAGVGLVPKRGCLLTLSYYAFPRWYEFGERQWNDILTEENRRTRGKAVPVPLCPPQIPHGREPGPPRWEAGD